MSMTRTIQIRVDRKTCIDVRLIMESFGAASSEQQSCFEVGPGDVVEVECETIFPTVETNDRIVGVRSRG